MRLSPHTAQHLLGTSSPVTVPRHPTGTFPGVHIRVPGLLGEPTGCGPSPCTWLSHALSTTPTPPLPRASAFHQASPLGYVPLAFPSRWELPMFTILDSCDVRQVAVTRSPFRSLRLPNALTDRQALRSGLFPLTGAEGVRLLLRLVWATACVGCPRKQGRTGDHFPVGSHPLQVDAP